MSRLAVRLWSGHTCLRSLVSTATVGASPCESRSHCATVCHRCRCTQGIRCRRYHRSHRSTTGADTY
jgi:hypothetical protein